MAGQQYGGIAYITLDGDQIEWLTKDPGTQKILLNGYHFRNAVSVASLAITALYGVVFLGILQQYLRRRGPREWETDSTGKKKYKHSVGTAMGCMMLCGGLLRHEQLRILTIDTGTTPQTFSIVSSTNAKRSSVPNILQWTFPWASFRRSRMVF